MDIQMIEFSKVPRGWRPTVSRTISLDNVPNPLAVAQNTGREIAQGLAEERGYDITRQQNFGMYIRPVYSSTPYCTEANRLVVEVYAI